MERKLAAILARWQAHCLRLAHLRPASVASKVGVKGIADEGVMMPLA
jgi:hypothetical protein